MLETNVNTQFSKTTNPERCIFLSNEKRIEQQCLKGIMLQKKNQSSPFGRQQAEGYLSGWASSYRRIWKFNDTITRVKLRIEILFTQVFPKQHQNETNRSSKTLQNLTLKGNRENSARFVVRFTDRKKTPFCILVGSIERCWDTYKFISEKSIQKSS